MCTKFIFFFVNIIVKFMIIKVIVFFLFYSGYFGKLSVIPVFRTLFRYFDYSGDFGKSSTSSVAPIREDYGSLS